MLAGKPKKEKVGTLVGNHPSTSVGIEAMYANPA